MKVGLVIYLCVLCFGLCIENFNPYQVLNVGRTASTADIRKSYKKLVKEWHPDKNNSPDAQDRFIQIQQAYEILSNEEKRNDYDTSGFTSDNNQQWSHQQHQHFTFSDLFRNDFAYDEGNARSVSYRKFFNQVLPDSYHTPQVLYVYSTFCTSCIVILRSSWEKAAKDLEILGVKAGTVDTTFTSRIAVNLRVSQLPTTVMIFEEQYYYHRGLVSSQNLKNFVVSNLPQDFVETVTSKNLEDFLSGINDDDKPRALLFSKQLQPTLLYTLMAIKHQQYFKFGFASLSNTDTRSIAKRFDVIGSGPTLLIFKEDIYKPTVTLQSSEMPRGAVNDVLTSHRHMTVPRITSQQVFDDVCPLPQDQLRYVQFCVIFAIDKTHPSFASSLTNLRKAVASALEKDEHLSEWLKFMFVVTSKQKSFVRSLSGEEEAPEEPAIYLVWRRSSIRGFVSTFSSKFLETQETLKHGFKQLLSVALRTSEQQQFERRTTFPTITDELAPFVLIRIVKQFKTSVSKLVRMVMYMNEHESMLLYITCFVGFLSIYSMLCKPRRRNTRRRYEQHPPDSSSEESDIEVDVAYTDDEDSLLIDDIPISLRELQPSSYEELVLRQKRGHLTIAVLLNENDFILKDFIKLVEVYERDPKLHFCYLKMTRYMSWYVGLRKGSSAQPPDSPDLADISDDSDASPHNRNGNKSTETVTASRTHGIVLAINGPKHWYCIFTPRIRRTAQGIFAENSTLSTSCMTSSAAAGGDNKFAPISAEGNQPGEGANVSRDLASSPEHLYLSRNGASEYYVTLTHWMDRVCEGHFPRLYVRQWPGLYVHTPEGSDEEDD